MDADSRYELQKIDCNCNDCFYMKRDFDTLNYWKEKDIVSQKEQFEKQRQKIISDAKSIEDAKERDGTIRKAQKNGVSAC